MRPRHSDRARRAAEDALDAAIDELRWWKSKIATRTVLSDDVVDAVASVASALQVDIAALSRALNAAYLDRRPRGEEDVEVILDQDDLETVVPKVGKEVVIVNGYGRGEEAVLTEILEKEFKGRVKLLEDGEIVDVDYECFSKKD